MLRLIQHRDRQVNDKNSRLVDDKLNWKINGKIETKRNYRDIWVPVWDNLWLERFCFLDFSFSQRCLASQQVLRFDELELFKAIQLLHLLDSMFRRELGFGISFFWCKSRWFNKEYMQIDRTVVFQVFRRSKFSDKRKRSVTCRSCCPVTILQIFLLPNQRWGITVVTEIRVFRQVDIEILKQVLWDKNRIHENLGSFIYYELKARHQKCWSPTTFWIGNLCLLYCQFFKLYHSQRQNLMTAYFS